MTHEDRTSPPQALHQEVDDGADRRPTSTGRSTGAIRSEAASLDDIFAEFVTATVSERQGRAIDRDQAASMEKKKREGYFRCVFLR